MTETVLAVEDIESARSFLNDALLMFGYSVICAEDGMDGLKKFRENKDRINVLLLELVMPKLTSHSEFPCLLGKQEQERKGQKYKPHMQ